MSDMSLTNTRLRAGIWQAVVALPSGAEPEIEVLHLEAPVQGVTLRPLPNQAGAFLLSVPIPLRALNDGVQTFVVQDRQDASTVGSFSVIAGSALDEDLRAEIDLLRAELDLLKRAFRRHCVETAGN